MLLRNLLKMLIAASTAVLVVHVTTTPETRLRLLGQAEKCLLLASGKAPKLSEHIPHGHEIQPIPSYNAQLHPRTFLVSELPVAKRLGILFTTALRPHNYRWYTIELLEKAAKHSWKLQNYANRISLWRGTSASVLRSRVFKAFSPRMRYIISTMLLREECIVILEFSLPLFTLLLHYFWRATSLLCLPSQYLFLWCCWGKSTTPSTATSSNAVTDETTSTEQVAETPNEDSPQSSASMLPSVSTPLSEPSATQCLSQMLLAPVSNIDKVTAELPEAQQSPVSNTVPEAPEPITQSIESLVMNETILSSDAAPPLRRKKTFPNSRLKQQQREALADLTQFVARKNSENRTPSFV